MSRGARPLVVALALCSVAAPPARAVDFGSSDLSQPLSADHCASYPCSLTNEVHADGTSEGGSPIDGILTSVRLRYRGDGAQAALRVLRPDGPGAFLNVGPEIAATLPDTAGDEQVVAFPVRHPIQAGDRLGLGAGSSFAGDAYLAAGAPRACLGAGSHPAGTTHAYSSGPCGSDELVLQGTVEPDGDGDGYGDVTQDGCPTDAQIHDGPCSANLGLTESVDPATVMLSGEVTYTMSVSNAGTSPAMNVGLKVPVSETARLVSATTTAGRCGGVRAVFCWLGTVPSGGAVTVQVTLLTGAPGNLTIRSTVSSTTSDPDATDNYASARANVIDPFEGVGLPAQTVTVRRGTARVLHSCPPGTPGYCQGAAALAAAAPVARGAASGATVPRTSGPRLGHAHFQLQPGAASRVPIHLSRRCRRLLEKRHRVEVVVTTRAVDAAGTKRTSYARVTLVAPKAKKKRHH